MKKKIVIVVDDHQIFLDRWKSHLSKENIDFFCFGHPFSFLEFCEDNRDKIRNIKFLVLDKKTASFDVVDSNFLSSFKRTYTDFKGRCLLSTALYDCEFLKNSDHGFDGICGKNPMSLKELQTTYG